MDLSEALLELVAPLPVGGVLEGATLLGASTQLGLRLTFEDPRGRLHVEVFPEGGPRRHAARSERLLFSYRAAETIEPRRGEALCRAVAELARANEERVLRALAEPSGGGRVRRIGCQSVLELAGTPAEPHFLMSPYVGCLIGCRFCYAQDRVGVVRRMRGLEDAPWGSYVDARVEAPAVLERELRELPPHPIKLCPIVSDPYHAIEAELRLTRRCLEVLRAASPRPFFVLTRARLVERDADLLEAMPEARVGFSVPSADPRVLRFFEPRAAPLEERLEVLRAMRRRGIQTFAVVQPVLPGEVERLADALAEVADSVSLDVLRGEEGARALFDAYPYARADSWQRERVEALREALRRRGVSIWRGELP